ncbi:SH3 domain-containing protein [Streptomyces sp. NPDC046261]|uniref:SH3 domain-containing protein n=1 Tax=Streptomyces sp. NPDC046261 TaxID=3157200 RepID=UPI0033F419AF
MFSTFAIRSRKVSAGVIAAAALGGSLLAAGPVQAAPPTRPYGTVVAASGIVERAYPSTDSSVRGIIKYHGQAALRCKVRAQDVAGNPVWYLLRDRATWVAAKYIENTGEVPVCKAVNRKSLDDAPETRAAMG